MQRSIEGSTVLRCGTFIDGSGAPSKSDVALIMQRERIVAIEPWSSDLATHLSSTNFRDLRGQTVTPGFIDAHAHLCFGAPGTPGWSELAADPLGLLAWGFAAGTAALLAGVTTVVDAGSPGGIALEVASMIQRGLVMGPQVMAAGTAITTTAGHGSEIGTSADNSDEMVRAVRRNVLAGAHIIKIMVTGGATDPSSNRRRAQYTERELRAAIDDAHRLGRRVIGHANATEGITRAVRAGIDIVAHCNWLGSKAGTLHVDQSTVATMVQNQTWVDLNIQGALRNLAETDGFVGSGASSESAPVSRWELLQPLRREGVPLYLSSDAFGPSIGMFTDSLMQLRTHGGLSAEELISLVSGEPARALGIDGDVGLLSPGKLADLIVFPGDLRVSPGALVRPLAVYKGGAEAVSVGRLEAPKAALTAGVGRDAQQELLDHVFAELS